METILVTGANGLVGSAIVKKLEGSGYSVLKIARAHDNDSYVCDLSQISCAELSKLTPDFDVIVHTAALIPRSRGDDNNELYDTNTRIDQLIYQLSEMKRARIIYISTCGLYKHNSSICDESSELDIHSYYFRSKCQGEQIFGNTGRATIARISSPFGDGMNNGVVISKFIDQAIGAHQINIWGRGDRAQNFVHVDDIAEFVKVAISSDLSEVYNVTADTSTTMKDLALVIQSLVSDCTIKYTETTSESEAVEFKYCNEKARKQMGWQPKKSLKDGLLEIIKNQDHLLS